MSYPADGEPRFKIVSSTGPHISSINKVGGGNTATHYILDRARCHHIVYESRSDKDAQPYVPTLKQTEMRCAELNAL